MTVPRDGTDAERLPLVVQMVPASNRWAEVDLARQLSGGARVWTEKLPLPEPVTVAGEWEMLVTHSPAAAARIASSHPAVVLFGCASASALLGDDGTRRLCERLGALAGAPVLGIDALVSAALERERITRPVLVVPYEPAIVDAMVASLELEGRAVAAARSMRIASNQAVGRITPEAIVRFTLASLVPEADGVLIACGNFNALGAAKAVRACTGLPVVTTNGAAADGIEDWLHHNTGS